jgi:predicted ATP-grasp superfamily ATP-dependent carboligase
MVESGDLLIVGASARAAAFSALRAGLRPWCVDLFADADLRWHCEVTRLTERYPHGLRPFIESNRPGPWMYTGGLENWPRLVEKWAVRRPLLGNTEWGISLARHPEHVAGLLQSEAMPAPALCRPGEAPPSTARWLLKPRRGAGGAGIRFHNGQEDQARNTVTYCQEFIEGRPAALIFLGDVTGARFLGMTRQLVGESWLHAAPFRYCGSIGPLDPSMVWHPSLACLGNVLACGCELLGLFGVDGILRDGTFWPVEINPRYTASVEVLEYATGVPLLGWHADVFTRGRIPAGPALSGRCVGKAVLFARDDVTFPADGPWTSSLASPGPVQEMPAFADVPAAGERIEAGRPVLTFFAAADSPSACEGALRRTAADLDRRLFGR